MLIAFACDIVDIISYDQETYLGAGLFLLHSPNMSSSSSALQSISDSDLSDPPSDIDDLELNFDSGAIKRTTNSHWRSSPAMPKNKGKGKKPAKRAFDEISPLDQEDEDTFLPNCLARLSIKKPRLDRDLSAIERLPNEVGILHLPYNSLVLLTDLI